MPIVFPNGCFDLLHEGHKHLLKECAKMGEVWVGLNSDVSVKKIKGPDRPVWSQEKRKEELLKLPYVSRVYTFDQPTPYEIISQLKPDIVVKGGDYKAEDVVGYDLVEEVRIIPLLGSYSTTRIIAQNKAIEKLIGLGSSMGLKRVDFVRDLECYGCVYLELALLEIRLNMSEEMQIATMCHELGHWFMYRIGVHKFFNFQEHRSWSEGWANFIGNLIRIFHAGRKNLSAEEWKKFKKSIVRW